MINRLIKLANHLDKKGLRKEADYLDSIIKMANENPFWDEERAKEIHGMGGYPVATLKKNVDDAWRQLQEGLVPLRHPAYQELLSYTSFVLKIRYDILGQDIKQKYKEIHGVNLENREGKRFAYNKYVEVMKRMGRAEPKSKPSKSYQYPLDIGWAKVTDIKESGGKVTSVTISLTDAMLKKYPGKKVRTYTPSNKAGLEGTIEALNSRHNLNLSI